MLDRGRRVNGVASERQWSGPVNRILLLPTGKRASIGGMSDYDRVKHLELISRAIERMDKGAQGMKALSPGALGVALVLLDRHVPAWLALSAAAIAVLIYWYLDAAYLGRERSFRALYEMVRKGELDDRPYFMEIGKLFAGKGIWKCMLSTVTLCIHGSILLLVAAAFVALSLFPGASHGP